MLYGNLNILSANLGTVLENLHEYENTGEFVFPGKDDWIQEDFVVGGLKGASGSNRMPENFNMKLGDISPRTLPIKTSKSWLGLIENRKQG